MFRNLWGYIAQEEKEGHAPQRSVITKGRDARSLPRDIFPAQNSPRASRERKIHDERSVARNLEEKAKEIRG